MRTLRENKQHFSTREALRKQTVNPAKSERASWEMRLDEWTRARSQMHCLPHGANYLRLEEKAASLISAQETVKPAVGSLAFCDEVWDIAPCPSPWIPSNATPVQTHWMQSLVYFLGLFHPGWADTC